MGNVCGRLDHRSIQRRRGSIGTRPDRGPLSLGPSSPLSSRSPERNARYVPAARPAATGSGPQQEEKGAEPTPNSASTLSTSGSAHASSTSHLWVGDVNSPSSPMYDFPQLTEKEKEHWKVFNELDNHDEADMLALSSFFQTVCATAARKGEALFPPVEAAHSRVGTVRDIRVQNVGRIDSNVHDLREYELPVKGKVTLDVALDIIDCYRRGGKLHVSSVHKILKAVYWMLKKFPNVREVSVPSIEQLPPPHSPVHARVNAPSCATTMTEGREEGTIWEEGQATEAGTRQESSQEEEMVNKLVVCGDLHGQFFDLLYVLDLNGPPGEQTKYLFNGDFVDRGPQSVEVVLTLFALQLAAPEHVYLNRGNHEDPGVCCLFGFMSEVMQKYDETTFSMFVEVFRHLPLATIINNQVAVVHGGMFHSTGVRLEDLQQAPRADYGYAGGGMGTHDDEAPSSVTRKHHGRAGAETRPVKGAKAPVVVESRNEVNDGNEENDEEEVRLYLHQLMKDLLWSDPKGSAGVVPNPRGEGVLFGPDVTEGFLRENNLRMIVRSHECVPLGFEQPYEGAYKQQLCTLFSASNYSSAGNQGAFLRFYFRPSTEEAQQQQQPPPQGYYTVRKLPRLDNRAPPPTNPTKNDLEENLHYTVHCFFMGDELGQERSLERSLQANLVSVVLKRRESLLRHFEAADTGGEKGPSTGLVTVEAWAEVMRLATKVQVQWSGLRELLVQEDCLVLDESTTAASESLPVFIKYREFLDSFQVQYKRAAKSKHVATKTFDALYVNRRQLEAFFAFFDKNNDGSISREEFRTGCETINAHLGPGTEDARIEEVDRLLDLLDFDQSNSVSANEFFECFRLLDSHGHLESSPAELQQRAYQQAQRRRASSKLLSSWSTSFNENHSSLTLTDNNHSGGRPSSLRVVTSPNGA